MVEVRQPRIHSTVPLSHMEAATIKHQERRISFEYIFKSLSYLSIF